MVETLICLSSFILLLLPFLVVVSFGKNFLDFSHTPLRLILILHWYFFRKTLRTTVLQVEYCCSYWLIDVTKHDKIFLIISLDLSYLNLKFKIWKCRKLKLWKCRKFKFRICRKIKFKKNKITIETK